MKSNKSMPIEDNAVDLSELRRPIHTSLGGLNQVIKVLEHCTTEVIILNNYYLQYCASWHVKWRMSLHDVMWNPVKSHTIVVIFSINNVILLTIISWTGIEKRRTIFYFLTYF